MNNDKKSKNWIIGLVLFLTISIIGAIVYYEKMTPKVFTKAEYVKEVIIQNQDFEKALDSFLDQVFSFNGSQASTEKLENTATKFPEFVEKLETKLEPRVPHESKSHYDNMIAAYKIYLEAIDMYRKAVPKNLGEERTTLINEAKSKLEEARQAMKNLN